MKSDQEFKADAGKTDPSLLEQGFPRALRLVQATLDYGVKKYEAHSWRQMPNALARYNVAARRHRQARDMDSHPREGFHAVLESCDHESGLPHIAHEVFNLLALIELEFKAHEDTSKANDLLMRIIGQMKEPPTSHKEETFEHVAYRRNTQPMSVLPPQTYRLCATCKHFEVPYTNHPCAGCGRVSLIDCRKTDKWEPVKND